MDETETDDESIIGQEAHIIARKNDGPRGESNLSPEQRDKYNNLVLLCSIHHKVIDDQPNHYTAEKVLGFKKEHEQWIKSSLSVNIKKQHDDEVYSTYLDKIIELAGVENWKNWTSYMYGGSYARMSREQYDNLKKLNEYILSRVWPKRYTKLEHSITNLKLVLNDFLNVFDTHSEAVNEESIETKKFYRINYWDAEEYQRLLDKYRYHIALVLDLTNELARAINYLFDNVRASLVPSFRIKEGVILIETGPSMDYTWTTIRLEYKNEEITDIPYPGLKNFMEIRKDRNYSFGAGISDEYFPIKI